MNIRFRSHSCHFGCSLLTPFDLRVGQTDDSREENAGTAKRHRQSSKRQPRQVEQQSEFPLRERGDRPLDHGEDDSCSNHLDVVLQLDKFDIREVCV